MSFQWHSAGLYLYLSLDEMSPGWQWQKEDQQHHHEDGMKEKLGAEVQESVYNKLIDCQLSRCVLPPTSAGLFTSRSYL